MKTVNLLTGVFLLFNSVLWAQTTPQDSLLVYYSKYPRQAILDADQMYQQAVQKKDNPLLIKSLILKNTYSLEINRDDYPALLTKLEDYIQGEKDIIVKSILHSYTAQLYSNYYNNNNYLIRQRTSLKEAASDDIDTWSPNLFEEKIYTHLTASIAPAEALQAIPVSTYKAILITGAASDSLRPTLYDFLGHRALDILSERLFYYPTLPPKIPLAIFGTATDFIDASLSTFKRNAAFYSLGIWQKLLAFHQKSGNIDALLMNDLERLDYADRIIQLPNKDSLYLATLQEMRTTYASTPMVVEVIAKEASLRLNRLKGTTVLPAQERDTKEQVLALCQGGIEKFPHYNRINLLYDIVQTIKAPAFSTEFPNIIYPGETLPLKIKSRNTTSVSITLYRIDMGTATYNAWKASEKKNAPKTVIQQKNYSLATGLVFQDTTIQLKVPRSGLYAVKITAQGIPDAVNGTFLTTSLFSIAQSKTNGIRFQVCDWLSGQAIKGAKILLYKYQYPNYKVIDSVYTDAQGYAIYSRKIDSRLLYEAVNAANPNGNLQNIYPSYRQKNPVPRIELITDRKIYRPGQTIYYKGYIWQETPDSIYALDNRVNEIRFLDANRKVISTQKARSNEFGSFTGNFVIPANVLNGTFTLNTGNHNFFIEVSDYKRPEFEITFTEPAHPYYIGDSIFIRGKINSMSGIPLGHTALRYEIRQYAHFSWPFTPPQEIQGSVYTLPDGTFEFGFKSEKPVSTNLRHIGMFGYEVNITATDTKGETQEAMTSIPVYPGIARPQLSIPEYVNKNEKTAFTISLSNLPAQTTGRIVHYSIDKLILPDKITTAEPTRIEKNILKNELLVQQTDSIFPDLRSLPSGAYLFTAQCDSITEKSVFYLYSPQDKRPPIPTYSWLIPQKTSCLPGDTARIQFGTSANNAYIHYEIYNHEKLIRQKSLILSDEILNIDIPYLSEYGRFIWLSLHYVKDKHFIQETILIERPRENRDLTVQTKTFRDKLQPGQEELWEVTVLNDKKQPAFAEVLAMMYDASLDQLFPYEVSLRANYFIPSFNKGWENSYVYTSSYQTGVYTRRKTLKIPGFKFDRLNLFLPSVTEIMDFGDCEAEIISEDSSIPTARLATKSLNNAAGFRKESAPVSTAPIELRQDFQETAFFYPQLKTDSSGNVNIRFKIPESLTKWKFIALATTPAMATGQLERYITTSKPLMVRPNLPRFFRSGDQNELRMIVSNLTQQIQQGTATLEFLLPGSEEVIFTQRQDFQTAPDENKTLSFNFTVPQNAGLLICRLTAISGEFSDGEQNLIPVLPDETLVTHTLPIYTQTAGTQQFGLPALSSGGKDYRLTLELTANPIWYAVLALPALTEPANPNVTDISAAYYVNTIASRLAKANPEIVAAIRQWSANPQDPNLVSKLEQNSELKSILLEASPWILQAQNETEQMQSLHRLFDQNRLDYLQKQALEKLGALQTPEGGWSWFKGMNSSRFMTLNVLAIMAKANTVGAQEYGQEEKSMQIKALRYLDQSIVQDFKHTPKRIGYDQILYLYVRSLYRDIPLGDALTAHKYFMSLAQKQWSRFSLYEKAITVITFKNYGFSAESHNILKSLRQYAVTDATAGMYWPNNRNEFYSNSAVQVHTALLEAFYETEGNSPDIDRMKQWLLQQKQVQSWESVPATVDAIHALLLTGKNLTERQDDLKVKLGKYDFTTSGHNDPLGYLKKSFTGKEIQPNMTTVRITKSSDTPTWGGLYLQRFEKLDQIESQKNRLSIGKQLFLAVKENNSTTLVPLKDQAVKTGDQVIVRLTLSLDKDMEFLHLKDMRAACFEPADQLSGNHWKFGSVYYQDIKDAVTNFFFNALARGTYVIEYPVWVNQAGKYQDGIATLQSIYAPEFNAYSSATEIEVSE